VWGGEVPGHGSSEKKSRPVEAKKKKLRIPVLRDPKRVAHRTNSSLSTNRRTRRRTFRGERERPSKGSKAARLEDESRPRRKDFAAQKTWNTLHKKRKRKFQISRK